jgi:hypothetical protein
MKHHGGPLDWRKLSKRPTLSARARLVGEHHDSQQISWQLAQARLRVKEFELRDDQFGNSASDEFSNSLSPTWLMSTPFWKAFDRARCGSTSYRGLPKLASSRPTAFPQARRKQNLDLSQPLFEPRRASDLERTSARMWPCSISCFRVMRNSGRATGRSLNPDLAERAERFQWRPFQDAVQGRTDLDRIERPDPRLTREAAAGFPGRIPSQFLSGVEYSAVPAD